ncbi:VIT domain-containing protein [Paracoccaceae bacterium]|nr:VIT domain-containing protein [Paracoccaceae bacterium]
MQPAAFGHQIQTLHEGLTIFQEGAGRLIPMQSTEIAIEIKAGVAIIRTQRVFRNEEDVAIEAVLTMPVGFDTVVTGLSATVDDRKLRATAKTQSAARDDYEGAIDEGKMAILHEEVLKGVHSLSVAQLAPGIEVMVELETVTSMGCIAGEPFLRIPTTVGQIYGTSPLMPADDLMTSSQVQFTAQISAVCDQGIATLDDGRIISEGEPVEVMLNNAIELRVANGCFGKVSGVSATGQIVEMELTPAKATDDLLDLAILVDRSGSTGTPIGNRFSFHNDPENGDKLGVSVWSAMQSGLTSSLSRLQSQDQISLWQFDNTCEKLGAAKGPSIVKSVQKLGQPAGGTELAGAVQKLLDFGARDILVLTDGQTWAHTVEELKSKKARISAILVGNNSLDANIGHLCAMTGGQVYYAPGANVTDAIAASLTSLRSGKNILSGELAAQLPLQLAVQRAGVEVAVSWSTTQTDADCDALGRYAAAMALPLLDTDAAQTLAEAHCLCSHMTSLVLVDEVGVITNIPPEMRKIPLMEPAAYPPMPCSSEVNFCKSYPRAGSSRGFKRVLSGNETPLDWLLMLILIPVLIVATPFIILWNIPSLVRHIWHMVQTAFGGEEKLSK